MDEGADSMEARGDNETDTGSECVKEWSDLQCWSVTNDDILCAGTFDCMTIRVIPPSAMAQAIDDGRYVPVGPPTCEDTWTLWESVECFEVTTAGGAVVCEGALNGVLVGSPDPCGDIPGEPNDYILIDGLYAWPTDPDDYAALPMVAWPG
jgi:hypothetical protein